VAPNGMVGDEALEHAEYFIYGSELSDGSRLYVAQDTEALEDLRETIKNTFLWGGGITVGLALLGGLAASWRFLRRIERINTAAQRIMDGSIDQRVPVGRGRDEFDRLSANLNRMLERIEILLNNQKRVTSDIAHDLRTPLTRLRQDLDDARHRPGSQQDYGRVIESALGDTDEILRTFGALLRIAEIDSGEQKSGFATVQLSELMDRLTETYGPVAEDSGHHLTSAIEPGISIRGDGSLLTQMFANLCENAIHHTPPGTTFTLGLKHRDGELIASVADTGPGVPLHERDRVFRPFYRLDESRSTPGSGLGLALVAAIARLHGASIELKDGAPGALFEVRIPV
jgi:signal transduction histidine kinase